MAVRRFRWRQRNSVFQYFAVLVQGSKIALVRSYLRVPQAAGQVKILIFLVKIKLFPIYANIFCDAGQVPISRPAYYIIFQEVRHLG